MPQSNHHVRNLVTNLKYKLHLNHLNNVPKIANIICHSGFTLLSDPMAIHQELVMVSAFTDLLNLLQFPG